MNNKTFIQRLSQTTGYTQDDSQKMVYSVVDAMNEQFQEGESVIFPGFGTFEVKKRMERIVVNPTSRQRMLVPPKLVVGFRPAASIRKVLKEGGDTPDGNKVRGLSASPVVAYIVQKHGIKAREAEQFVGSFIAIVNEALRTEKQVKVKGLGTFKVVDVKERQSVDVNTGERILIEGRSKISFTPDSVMKDLVNKPFSQFETVVLNEGVTFDDIDESADEDEPDSMIVEEEAPADEPIVIDESPIVQQEEAEEQPVAPIVDNAEPLPNDDDEPFALVENDAEEAPIVNEEETAEEAPIVNEEPVEEEHPISISEPQPTEEVESVSTLLHHDEPQEEEETEEMSNDKKSTPWCMYLLIGLVSALIGAGIGWTIRDRMNIVKAPDTSTVPPIAVDTIAETDSLQAARQAAELLRKDSLEQLRRDSLEKIRRDSIEKARRDSLEKVQRDLERVKKELEAQKEAEQKARQEALRKEQEAAKTAASQKPSLALARRQAELGAYRIVGTQETITVKEGQTMARLAKFYFGDGMECYLQIHNGVTEVKPGMRLKIPKLRIKKKR